MSQTSRSGGPYFSEVEKIPFASETAPGSESQRKDLAFRWYDPEQIVLVTRNCLNCHTGPGERVVNEGGHQPGSDFELVSRLRGEVRHNFHRTNQGANAEITPERLYRQEREPTLLRVTPRRVRRV